MRSALVDYCNMISALAVGCGGVLGVHAHPVPRRPPRGNEGVDLGEKVVRHLAGVVGVALPGSAPRARLRRAIHIRPLRLQRIALPLPIFPRQLARKLVLEREARLLDNVG